MERFRETLQVKRERAILAVARVKLAGPGDDLAELTALAESAGAIIVGRFQQKVRSIHPATCIGKGKARQLADRVQDVQAEVVIFDNNLSPAQIRGLEEIVQVKVVDRSELILDIFATRAQTKQAKLQVELAQLEYTYPRLTRMWSHLDTVAGAGGGTAAGSVGGIGTRGPGEQQLEIDRRLVQKRIMDLRRELDVIDQRKLREISTRSHQFKICLVGYTNAGKSTLLNAMTGSDVLVADRLFATLDTRTRKWTPEKGVEILVSDTVGFVRDLPHQLVESFKATLEEAVNADLLIHVVDVSNPEVVAQIESVDRVLEEIGCRQKPTIKAFNKADVVHQFSQLDMLQAIHPDGVTVSAKTGMGLNRLHDAVLARYIGSQVQVRVRLAPSEGKVQSFLRANGRILREDYDEHRMEMEVVLDRNQMPALHRLHPGEIEIL